MLKGRRREQNGRVKTELRQTHMILQGRTSSPDPIPRETAEGECHLLLIQEHSSPHKDGQLPLQQNTCKVSPPPAPNMEQVVYPELRQTLRMLQKQVCAEPKAKLWRPLLIAPGRCSL